MNPDLDPSTCDPGQPTGIKAVGCHWAFVSITDNFFASYNWETRQFDKHLQGGNVCLQEDGSVWPLIKYDWNCSYTTDRDCTSKFIFHSAGVDGYYYI